MILKYSPRVESWRHACSHVSRQVRVLQSLYQVGGDLLEESEQFFDEVRARPPSWLRRAAVPPVMTITSVRRMSARGAARPYRPCQAICQNLESTIDGAPSKVAASAPLPAVSISSPTRRGSVADPPCHQFVDAIGMRASLRSAQLFFLAKIIARARAKQTLVLMPIYRQARDDFCIRWPVNQCRHAPRLCGERSATPDWVPRMSWINTSSIRSTLPRHSICTMRTSLASR